MFYALAELSKAFLSSPKMDRTSVQIRLHPPPINTHIDPKQLRVDERSKELLCKSILERVTQMPFRKTRAIPWLVNPHTKRRLELDLYNASLNVGLEFDGVQHFKYIQGVHKSIDVFQKMQERDTLKTNLCKSHGLKLIRIPYWLTETEIENLIINSL